MLILIGCEESQAVTKAMRALGHEAYSCDIKPCSGGHPEWHLQMDVFEAIALRDWELGIFFPDCTYLTVSANKWYKDQPVRASGTLVGQARRDAREQAVEFFMTLYDCKIPKVALENPIGVMSTRFRKPNKVLQPWMFGHGETKATCIWSRGLPEIYATKFVSERVQRIANLPPSTDRAEIRSKTYQGIADAMAMQWAGKLQ